MQKADTDRTEGLGGHKTSGPGHRAIRNPAILDVEISHGGERENEPLNKYCSVADRGAAYLAGTSRSVGRGWPEGHFLPD